MDSANRKERKREEYKEMKIVNDDKEKVVEE